MPYISDHDLCQICSNPIRDHSIICVVEDIRDVMAIENTGQYKGVFMFWVEEFHRWME